MESEALKAGKDRIRQHLIDPLARQGMKRAGGLTVAQHEAAMEGLAARLAYLTVENIEALAEVVSTKGAGKNKDRWPPELVICNWARQLQEPPPSDSRLVTSYMRSKGRQAKAEGWAVELYGYLKKMGQPPNDFAMSRLKLDADTNMRTRHRIEREARFGTLSSQDRQWLEWYIHMEGRVAALLDAQDQEAGDA